jgi:hypothetical protein
MKITYRLMPNSLDTSITFYGDRLALFHEDPGPHATKQELVDWAFWKSQSEAIPYVVKLRELRRTDARFRNVYVYDGYQLQTPRRSGKKWITDISGR